MLLDNPVNLCLSVGEGFRLRQIRLNNWYWIVLYFFDPEKTLLRFIVSNVPTNQEGFDLKFTSDKIVIWLHCVILEVVILRNFGGCYIV